MKHITKIVLQDVEQKINQGYFAPKSKLTKIEATLTSKIELKYQNNQPYYYAFFQLERSSEVFDKASQGLNQDIPVIFKADSSLDPEEQTPPPIPPRAKVLLEGKWADSTQSQRPSFTCLAFQVISNPPPITVKDLKEQISSLLSTSLTKKKEWQDRTDFLFRKQKDLQEIEKLSKLGEEYLQAYLLLRKAFYSNYQDNLLALNQWNQDQYLNKLASEIEDIACQVRAYQSKQI